MKALTVIRTQDGDWYYREWDDGCCQHIHQSGSYLFIEQEKQAKGNRTQLHIVDRSGDKNKRWPPIVSGPFPDLDSAKAAHALLRRLESENG